MNNSVDSDQSYSSGVEEDSYVEEEENDRNEVEEVRKMSSKDMTRIIFSRVMVTMVLLLTAFAVTFATYTFLAKQETENLEVAVRSIHYFLADLDWTHAILTLNFFAILTLLLQTILSNSWQCRC